MTRLHSAVPVLIALVIALPASAQLPTEITTEHASEPLDADDFILTLPVVRTGEDAEVLLLFGEMNGPADRFTALRVTGDSVEVVSVEGSVPKVTHRSSAMLRDGRFDLTVHARGPHLVLSEADDLLAHFLHEGLPSGFVGTRAHQGATVGDLLVQPLGDVVFDEDFFATEQVPDRWETLRGEWEVGIYWDPLQEMDDRPIGASWYQPGGGECLTAAGYEIFDSYRLSASARLPQGRGGLAFHVRGPEDYCAFEVGGGLARLVQVAGGERVVLDEAPVELRPDWWFRLRVDVSTGHARAFVNDRPLVEARLSPALRGRIGLTAHSAAGSRFDDISARPHVATHIPEGATAQQALVFSDGDWRIEDGVLAGHVRGATVAGLPGSHSDSEVSAEVSATRDAIVGVVAGHQPHGHKRALIFSIKASDEPTWQLHHVDGEKTMRLAGGPAPSASGRMSLRSVGGRITCLLDGQVLHETYLAGQLHGRAGVYLQGGRATFRDLACRELTGEPQAVISHADGSNTAVPSIGDKTTVRPIGDLWRPRAGSWRCRPTEDGPRIIASGDRGFNIPTLRFHEVTPGEPRLIVNATHGLDARVTLGICMGDEPGYEVEYNETRSAFRLLRRGELIFESGEGSDGTCGPGEIRRDGDWVVIGARLEDEIRTVYAWSDPDPLQDGYAEVRTTDGEVRFGSITLASDSALEYRFDRIEPDWQPRSGEWTDHTGMACIPWDYWMTADGREEPAFTWNRHRLPEDVTLDISAAEFTEGYESGAHEHFPYHDISVILGGTPGDPDSGYHFIVGEEKGVRTVLLRDGVVVASTDDRRFRIVMGGHNNTPRAVRIRAQRAGDTLTLLVNGREAISWTDPEPLSGPGHVGLGANGCRVLLRDCVVYPGAGAGS